MKTVTCDFCKKQSKDTKEYIFPLYDTIEVRGGSNNSMLLGFSQSLTDMKKDVCRDCQKKIAELLENIKYVKINKKH